MAPELPSDATRRIASAFPLVNAHPDVAGVLRQADLLALLGPVLAAPYVDHGVTVVVAPEARGPIVGALVAVELGAGLVLARKDDRNHPGADLRITSAPTWRGHPETFQTRSFDLVATDRVLVVDDWITTGSSIRAAIEFIQTCGATYVGGSVLVNKAEPATLADLGVKAAISFSELGAP